MYIGSATGRKGLKARIHEGHLKKSYLNNVFSKSSTLDQYQISLDVRNSNNKQVIDKSRLRLSVGREYKLAPGEATVDYIKSNFDIYTYVPDFNEEFDKEAIKLLRTITPEVTEENLIETSISHLMFTSSILTLERILINIYLPKYND